MVKKTFTNASYAIKSSGERKIYVDKRQVRTSGLLRCNVQNVKKTFARADNLKRHKFKLDQETGCSPDSVKAPSNNVTTEKPTDKDLANTSAGEASFVYESPTKQKV